MAGPPSGTMDGLESMSMNWTVRTMSAQLATKSLPGVCPNRAKTVRGLPVGGLRHKVQALNQALVKMDQTLMMMISRSLAMPGS